MSRGSMLMISAATAGILIAGTAAAVSVVNATQTTPTSNSIDLMPDNSRPLSPAAVLPQPPQEGNALMPHDRDGDDD